MADTKATPTDRLLAGLDAMGAAYNIPPGTRAGQLMLDAAKEIRALRTALTPTTDGEREAATSPFVAGTGLMGATEPGQRVTAENAHRLPPGSVVRLDDGGRLIHLHDDLWLWLSSSGAAYCYDRIERFHYCLPASLCHLPVATERAKAADAARERAAIVAWLREQASEMVKLNQHDDVRLRGAAYLNTANAIERGAHTKVTP